jgi:isopentenyl-diphosphate Delta-isomerase
MMPSTTSKRKDAHLDLCAEGAVEPTENDTLLSDVRLLHCAMPEFGLSDVSLSKTWFGKTLSAPLMMTGMTGGSERSKQVNYDLALVAEEFNLAFGVGSQRAMAEDDSLVASFAVKTVAPKVTLLGNIGLVQLKKMGVSGALKLKDKIQADALAVHLNPGQELAQPEGDRDFSGGYAVIELLARELGPQLLVKETGCGLSPQVARRLVECGVKNLDVSGLGGTSWVRVEELRASGEHREVAGHFSGWGIPTAAAVALVRRMVPNDVTLVASGGMRTGLDAARAMALGADVAGMALPFFKAQQQGGVEGARAAVRVVLETLKMSMLLSGCRSVNELKKTPKSITGSLKQYLDGFQP